MAHATRRLTLLRVIADEREKPSGVPQELQRMGVMVDYRVLDVADYIVRDYAIERKSSRDFVSSLFSGRLFDQAYRLGEAYPTTILIVEGDLDGEMSKLKNPRSIWGGLISAVLDFRLACFYTKDERQTAQFILTLGKGGRFKGRSAGPPVVVRKPKAADIRRVQTSIVESLPSVGPQMAEQLLTSLGSVRKAFAASVTEMAIGAGIGRSRALTINRILDAPYKASKSGPGQAQLR
jgi:DNA excision repair protein ERCC-4